MSTDPKALGVAMGGIASASQAAVTATTTTTTTTATTTALETDLDAVRVLVNQLRQDLVSAGLSQVLHNA